MMANKMFSLDQIDAVVNQLIKELQGGDVVVLVGEMGVGKTTIVKACAKALGVEEEITSPTFSIVEEHVCTTNHDSIKRIIHVDTYRIEFENEIFDIGLENIFAQDALTFIEWGERIENLIDGNYQRWVIEEVPDGQRSILVESKEN